MVHCPQSSAKSQHSVGNRMTGKLYIDRATQDMHKMGCKCNWDEVDWVGTSQSTCEKVIQVCTVYHQIELLSRDRVQGDKGRG